MSMINIAYSGAQAAQSQLNTTAMNTANAYTPGYSRQRAEQSALVGYGMSAGSGVEVTSIRRISDQYLVNQLWRSHSENGYYSMNQQYVGALEQIIGSESTGLGYGLDKLFASMNSATSKPDNRALREQVINEAKATATRFNSINEFINTQQQGITTQRDATMTSINSMSSSLAEFNKQISELEAKGYNANALRDERDQMINELSNLVEVRVTEAGDGTLTIALKDGQPLVSGRNSSTLQMGVDGSGNPAMQLTFSGTTFGVDMSTGGQLGALHDYETGTLAEMQSTVASMAKSIAENFNAQLAKGYDLNGQPGKPLFTFDPNNPKGMLQVTDISSDELAFSSADDEEGNGENLQALINIKNENMPIDGLGNMSLSDASAALVSKVGIASRQNQVELRAAGAVLHEAQTQRDSLSAVNLDEEAVNLLVYTQAYQSNLKVIATGDQIFSDLLALF
ncbi:flagellar hook-associated protein FlgK [Pragia fontium]|uniref:Flagellar hook-associated protein 1 n=2 Tax=Pragia fontium TaxID=82985 RepID=A0AAJ4W7N3_9GAMM|nr:flagellar hook-associated protein FlgK [Pragia fontium]GKX62948.1 flagellar hook-associated protein 1 [Pragia fontium]SFC01331.1 flagellar hook-associated protein 1 FlgK [Pragia fontium DSM 5563 = ATCC 49100]SUB81641.1 Flagellar hook-associated protein 1 [Pragia fontium]VEJ54120.1 Flagellar hook-associated protein 1 [Pragia fontium]